MARPALQVLDLLDFLSVDSLLFISDEADERAEAGRDNGLDDAIGIAADPAYGLEIAGTALDGTPVEGPGGPPSLSFGTGGSGSGPAAGRSNAPVEAGDITLLGPQVFGARGGVPGPPGDVGGDDGGGDDGVLTNYYSGSSLGTDTNPGADDPGFDIWLEFKGSDWTTDLQLAFTQAADYLTTVITDDIGGGGKYRGKTIDDLYISAELKAIDGEGGILGQAGPTAVWTANDLTAAGVIQLDVADALNFLSLGLMDDIVTHEMMHVLGFGTLWEYADHDLVDGYNYIGQAGVDAFEAFMGDDTLNFIPVEEDGGSGTAGGHWDEGVHEGDVGDEVTVDFNELMTGYINSDGDSTTDNDNYLSEFSVMSLADLGYAVSYLDYSYDDTVIV